MKCTLCGHEESVVLDVRTIDGKVYRKRECLECATTYKTVEVETTDSISHGKALNRKRQRMNFVKKIKPIYKEG